MKLKVCRASEWDESKNPNVPGAYKENDLWYVDISTMEELMALLETVDQSGIIYPPRTDDDGDEFEPCIQIYDDYIE